MKLGVFFLFILTIWAILWPPGGHLENKIFAMKVVVLYIYWQSRSFPPDNYCKKYGFYCVPRHKCKRPNRIVRHIPGCPYRKVCCKPCKCTILLSRVGAVMHPYHTSSGNNPRLCKLCHKIYSIGLIRIKRKNMPLKITS
jgi:hypothetical protein